MRLSFGLHSLALQPMRLLHGLHLLVCLVALLPHQEIVEDGEAPTETEAPAEAETNEPLPEE